MAAESNELIICVKTEYSSMSLLIIEDINLQAGRDVLELENARVARSIAPGQCLLRGGNLASEPHARLGRS